VLRPTPVGASIASDLSPGSRRSSVGQSVAVIPAGRVPAQLSRGFDRQTVHKKILYLSPANSHVCRPCRLAALQRAAFRSRLSRRCIQWPDTSLRTRCMLLGDAPDAVDDRRCTRRPGSSYRSSTRVWKSRKLSTGSRLRPRSMPLVELQLDPPPAGDRWRPRSAAEVHREIGLYREAVDAAHP